MDKKMINQKEYLKKYLSSGKEKKKVKKKKPNLGSKTVKIIDDDIDLNRMRAIEEGEFDILNNTEDAPQIAGIVDERGPVDFTDKRRWKIITDDGYGDISVTSVQRNDESSPRDKTDDPKSNKNHSGAGDNDFSPPRKSRKNSDSDEPRRKKSLKKKNQRLASSPVENDSGSEKNDFSPPRKSKKNSDSDEPRRKQSSSKKKRRSGSSPVKNDSGSEDSDFSPPRKSKKNSDTEERGRKKYSSKRNENRSGTEDSDFSPPRRTRKNSDSDLSPPRNSKPEGREKGEHNSNSRKKYEDKYNKRRENSSRNSRSRNYEERMSRNRSSASPSMKTRDFDDHSSRSKDRKDPSHKSGKYRSGNDSFEHEKNRHRSKDDRRKKDSSASPRSRRRTHGEERRNKNLHSRGGNNSDSDLSPPREKKQKSKNVYPESNSGESSRNKSKNFEPESNNAKKNTFKNYQEMTEETSGFGQAPILRDRKTGRRRDLAAEAREKEEKDGKRQELEEKYAQWGRGLKQVEDRQQKLDSDLYEMSKPLARYADDADLERELKAQERDGDPMLAYMKRKQVKEGKQEPEMPKYKGPSMPNRFGIRPGYRWDGVDRSNGYEKKWFEAQNARKAVQEEAYKWSTADM